MSDTIIGTHLQCVDCSSTDAMSVFRKEEDDTPYIHCFSCSAHHAVSEEDLHTICNGDTSPKERKILGFRDRDLKVGPLRDRGLTTATLRRYGVGVELNRDNTSILCHVYPYRNSSGSITAQKIRYVKDKRFFWEGDPHASRLLFGMHLYPSPPKKVLITEGELDAMAADQMQGNKFSNFSVSSASNAVKDIRNEIVYQYLMQCEDIILMFDNDEAGKTAALKVAELFPSGKVSIFPHKEGYKDACDYLKNGKEAEFRKLFWQAAEFRPEGIVVSSELKDSLRNFSYTKGLPYPFASWNNMTYGMRRGELVVLAARRNVGKTTIMRELVYGILQNDPDAKIGTMFFEETKERSGLGLLSLAANAPMHLPDSQWTDDQFDIVYEEVMADGRVGFYNHNGVLELDRVVEYIRYYAKGMECDYIMLDHIGKIKSKDSRIPGPAFLDQIGGTLQSLAIELNVCIIASIHLNREGMIRGGDGPENSADVVIELSREKDEDLDIEFTKAVVSKNRLYGFTGECYPLIYDKKTGRLQEDENYAAAARLAEEM